MVEPLKRREWQPGIAESDGLVDAYSVYPLESIDGWHPVELVSEAMTRYYSAPTGEDAYNAAKEPIRAAIKDASGKLEGKLASLQRSMTDESERELLRKGGELILAYQYAIQPKQTELRAQYDLDAPELVIALDPALTPLENAQKYFDKYNRAKRALDDVPGLIKQTGNELGWLAQLATDLELANNWPEIDEVQQALQAQGYWKGKPRARMGGGGKSAPLRIVSKDGFVDLDRAEQPPERDGHFRQGRSAGFVAARARRRRCTRDHQGRWAADPRKPDRAGRGAGCLLQRQPQREQRHRRRD